MKCSLVVWSNFGGGVYLKDMNINLLVCFERGHEGIFVNYDDNDVVLVYMFYDACYVSYAIDNV